MTTEQFFPTRWVLYGMDRDTLAAHVRHLRRVAGNKVAKGCIAHAIWVGVYPIKWPKR